MPKVRTTVKYQRKLGSSPPSALDRSLRAPHDARAMKAGIALKLFLVILAAAAVAAAAMARAPRASFQSGCLGYLNQVDTQRIDGLAGRLADEYRRAGSWDFLRDDY